MYKYVKKGWDKHLDFTVLDVVCLEIAFVLSYYIRHGIDSISLPTEYRLILVQILLVDLAVVLIFQSYKGILRRSKLRELKTTVKHVSAVMMGIVVCAFLVKRGGYSRQVFIIAYILGIIFCYITRLFWKMHLQKHYSELKNLRACYLVTTSDRVDAVLADILHAGIRDYRVTAIAIIDRDMVGETIRNVPVEADMTTLFEYAGKAVVDEVILNIPDQPKAINQMADTFIKMGTTVHIDMEELYSDLPNRIIEKFGGRNFLTASANVAFSRQLLIKRTMDIMGGLVGVICTIIIGIFLVPAILIESTGPAIFAQTRIGRNGRKFKMYKFRSMYQDAEKRKADLMELNQMDGLMFKIDKDPRITKTGAFIRKTSLDEFPQFFNVLIGNMSLVGTRPPTEDEFERYKLDYKKRLSFRPGITGMWQVSGRSDITNFEEVVKLDNDYINNWSIGLDIHILAQTVRAVLTRKGSK